MRPPSPRLALGIVLLALLAAGPVLVWAGYQLAQADSAMLNAIICEELPLDTIPSPRRP